MSKENIYSKRVDSFQGYLRFHGNVSIKFLHKKRRKRKIFLQVTQEIVFLLNYRKIIYNFCQVYYSKYDILRVIVVEVGVAKSIQTTNNILDPKQNHHIQKETQPLSCLSISCQHACHWTNPSILEPPLPHLWDISHETFR